MIDFDKLTKGVLIFSLLLVAFSFFYYYIIFLPKKEQAELELQKQLQKAELELQKQEQLTNEEKETISLKAYESIKTELPHHFVVCFATKKISCVDDVCEDLPPNTFYLFSGTRSQGTISRCDKYGCDTYDAIAQQSGLYENVQPVEPRGFIFKRLVSEENHRFVDVASIGLVVVITSGYCEDI